MCGRYALELALEHPQYLAGVELAAPITNYNVAPTHTVPVLVDRLTASETYTQPADSFFTREIHAARWGLLPTWADDPAFASRTFNARSETALTKPTFRDAAISGHCAMPVTGYYEWKSETTLGGKTRKTPYLVRRVDRRPIYLAGLYTWWRIPEAHAVPGATFEGRAGQWLLTCSILTMDSPGNGEFNTGILTDLGGELPYVHPIEEELGQLHNRLPIPLGVASDAGISEDDALTRWLRSGRPAGAQASADPILKAKTQQDAQAALDGIRAQAFAQTHTWELYPVSTDVGRVAHNAPYLLEPVEDLLSGL